MTDADRKDGTVQVQRDGRCWRWHAAPFYSWEPLGRIRVLDDHVDRFVAFNLDGRAIVASPLRRMAVAALVEHVDGQAAAYQAEALS